MDLAALPKPRTESPRRVQINWQKVARSGVFYAAMLLLTFIFILPLLWMVSTSLKDDAQTYHVPPVWLPWPMRIANYPEALRAQPFGLFFLNSFRYGILSVIGQILACSLAAYGFARLRWRGRGVLFAICLATMMIPYQVTMVPLFLTFKHLDWINSYKPLIVPAFFAAPFNVFLLRQFFMTIPHELSEAARMDGATEIGILVRIILPLARPALAVVGLFTFMGAWDNYLGPLIYINDQTRYPVALGLQLFKSNFVEKLAWPYLMAATTVTILPVVILFYLTQKTLVEGISITGIKA